MTISNTGGADPVIQGQTNLPDGTQLIVSLEKTNGPLMGQDNVTVSGGAFQTDQYSDHGNPYAPGIYTVEISSGEATIQPQSVQVIIGDHGQNMNLGGPVIADQFNLAAGGKVVDYFTAIKIP